MIIYHYYASLYINYSNSHPLIVPFIRIIGVSIFMVQGIGLLNISLKTRKKYNYLLFILTIGIFQSLTLFFSIIGFSQNSSNKFLASNMGISYSYSLRRIP